MYPEEYLEPAIGLSRRSTVYGGGVESLPGLQEWYITIEENLEVTTVGITGNSRNHWKLCSKNLK